MHFLVDEMKARGHDVVWAQQRCRGADDEIVEALANSEGRIVISEDRDFGDLVIHQRVPAIGVIRCKMSAFPQSSAEIAVHVANELERLGKRLRGFLTTVRPGRTRHRRLPNPL